MGHNDKKKQNHFPFTFYVIEVELIHDDNTFCHILFFDQFLFVVVLCYNVNPKNSPKSHYSHLHYKCFQCVKNTQRTFLQGWKDEMYKKKLLYVE